MSNKKHYAGLTDEEVLESRKKYGNNLLTPPPKSPLWKLFLEKFEDPIIRILLIAAFLSLGISIIHNEYAETIGIFCAIFLATGVAFWFEYDANQKFNILNQVNDEDPIMVTRNDNICQVSKRDIVVGDIIFLETGNVVPADGELLEAISLQIDESTLTGEPSIDKSTNPADFEEGVTYPSNYVLRGTKVIDGHGVYKVMKVGDSTEFGRVAIKATEKVEKQTPLNKQLNTLSKFISIVGLFLAVMTFSSLFVKNILLGEGITITLGQLGLLGTVIIGLTVALAKMWVPIIYDGLELMGKVKKVPHCIVNRRWIVWIILGFFVTILLMLSGFLFGVNPFQASSWVSIEIAGEILQYFMIAVTLVVVAVPEGLPMSVTLSLALSMRRMLKMNNLVRKMHACETMGATTVICTDKTGTLTQNQMQVYQTNFYSLKNQELGNDSLSNLIVESIATNSTAYLDYSEKEKINVLGNPTEGALLLWLDKHNINYLEVREEIPLIEQLPFSTERKYMATIIKSHALEGKEVVFVKGAPEVILSKCSTIKNVVSEEQIEKYITTINSQLLKYQNQAMRTLGFAYKVLDQKSGDISDAIADNDLVFLGIVAISDPVRTDVPAAVEKCLEAGIKVKIVTGDTYNTAKEIGRQIHIWNDDTDNDQHIISGIDFENLTDEEASKRIKELKIMCRARPTDKQRFVYLLKKQDEVVAVTGDGTNDAPALNYADVGLSMGSGTSVAKEASDITLIDDSFSSIATAVMWGRSLYQNIQRFLLFQLTINVAALLVVFLGSLLGHTLPLTVTQMLWVNLIMDTFAAGALASLPPNPNVMNDKPRSSNTFIVTHLMARWILIIGVIFVIILIGMMIYFSDADHLNSFFDYIIPQKREGYFLSYFFTVFVMFQFWNLFNAKAFLTGKSAFAGLSKSFGFEIVALVILFGQIIIVTFGGEVFRTMPLTITDWTKIILGTSLVFWVGELIRLIRK